MRAFPLLAVAAAVAVLLAAPSLAQTDAPTEGPFTRTELLRYLRANVPNWADPSYDEACQRAAATVGERGIAFPYDGSFDEELHGAGACPAVISAMQQRALQAIAPPPETTAPPPTRGPACEGDASGGDGWCPGDRVEAYEWGWYPASVIERGTGTHVGHYKVLFDGHANWKWVRAENVRGAPVSGAPETDAAAAVEPRRGRYQVWSYGDVRNPLFLGYVELLSEGTYRVLDTAERAVGRGRYGFEGGASAVRWESGPYAEAYGQSGFETKRGGAEHVLRLNRVTIASNSSN